MLSPDKNFAQLKPLFLPTPFWIAHRVEVSSYSKQFNVGQSQFGALATEETFKFLHPHLLEIDIQSEVAMLQEDCYLEIVLPVLNLTDLINNSFKNVAQKFPCVLGFNGFGAKTNLNEATSHARPDFMSVIDLVGNQYEILLNANGGIELPQEGAGRFTLIRAITCVYSAEQVQGRALEDLRHCQLKENCLYVLPPVETVENFSLQIAVVHLTEGQRKVQSIKTVKVAFKDNTAMDYSAQIKSQADNINEIGVETFLPTLKRCVATLTFKNVISLKIPNISPDETSTNGWLQHPVYPNVMSKRLGLSDQTFIHIIRQLYSQYDLMKDYLQGDNFGLLQFQQYNDFLLRPESFETFYDLLLHHIVRYKQGNFIFNRIPPERIFELSLLDLPVDFHDSVVLAQLQKEILAHQVENFKKLFTLYQSLHQESFFVELNDSNEVPSVEINVFYDTDFLENKIKTNLPAVQEISEKVPESDLYQLPTIDMGE